MLKRSIEPLSRGYDLAMLDLDGVVYVGDDAVAGAADHLASARADGMHLAFVTNNASRPPERVAEHLQELGVEAQASDVVTSAQAAAHLLAGRLERGSRVFLLGAAGLEQALRAEGLVPVAELGHEPVAVVSGYAPEVPWRRVMQAAVLIGDGVPWVASNTDLTIPTEYGIGPGHGVLVRMLTDVTGVTPSVAGKPERALLDETVRRVGGRRPLMVGDRLDTDIEGAANAGVDSLLVLTGVSGLAELVAAPPRLRPTYLACDLGGLLVEHRVPTFRDGVATEGGWQAWLDGSRLQVDGSGVAAGWWRAAAVAAWAYLDESGHVADTVHLKPPTGAEKVG